MRIAKWKKNFLSKTILLMTEKDISTDREALKEMLTKTKILMPPVTDVDGNIVNGFDKDKLKNLLGIS